MPLVTTRSVILQTYRYSDTSKILRLMTVEHGPTSVVARGALRPRSRFGGLLEPFAEGDATLYLKEGRDLHTLSAFELVRARRGLGSDLRRLSGASVLSELVMRLAPEHRDDRLYGLLATGLNALADAPEDPSDTIALRAIWAMVSTLGFEPDLRGCMECGREILSRESARFDFAAGGLRCGHCSPHGRLMSADVLLSLRGLSGHGDEPHVSGPQADLLADFIQYHMTEGARLRSLPFLRRLGAPETWV